MASSNRGGTENRQAHRDCRGRASFLRTAQRYCVAAKTGIRDRAVVAAQRKENFDTPQKSSIAVCILLGEILVALSSLQAAETGSAGKHCLWRITNAPAPFYLLGSVHALQRTDYQRVPAIEEAIKQSQQVLFEVDPKEDEVFAKKLSEAARLPRGQQIIGKVSPKTYNYLRKISLNGMNEWQHLHPWAVAMLLTYPKLQGVSYIYG